MIKINHQILILVVLIGSLTLLSKVMDNILCFCVMGCMSHLIQAVIIGKLRWSTTLMYSISVTCGCCRLGTTHNKKLTYWRCFPILG